MKHASRLSRAGAALSALVLLLGLAAWAQAQTITPTPDSFIVQVTTTTIPPVATPTPSPTPTPTATPTPTTTLGANIPRNSFASGISGDGRFVVIESQGDIATNRTNERNNADGNPEIFLFDYAQRRIYQITNTKNALKSTTASPIDPANIDVQVVNLRPAISHDGRFIAFISNGYVDNAATSPQNFDGNAHAAALKLDGNTEVWLYAVPEAPAADLTVGAEVPATDLSQGTMTRVTTTPATTVPRAGALSLSPFFARDNDAPAVNDDGSVVAFTTFARSGITGVTNTDGNQEVVLFNRTGGTFVQVTNTADEPVPNDPIARLVYNQNPSLSGNGQVIAFESNANINTTEADADQDNGEIYVANFNGAAVSNVRPVTRTPPERRANFIGTPVNILSPGQRLSRDGTRLAFESSALFNADGSLPTGTAGGLGNTYGIYVYNIASNTFAQVMARAPETEDPDIFRRFPTFTGDSTRVVWVSDLNVRADGTVALDGAADGLNSVRITQIFTAPVASLGTTNQGISRLTRLPTRFAITQPFPSDTVRRFAFGIAASELGGGNSDGLFEAFYGLIPAVTSEVPAPSPTPAASPAPVSFFTGPSDRPVVTPSPTPPAVAALAPGMLGIARSTLTLAPAEREVNRADAHELLRRPPLPVELNGVSVSISNAAAGLYFVSANQINFVVPPGLIPTAATALPVVINNNGSVIRTSLPVLQAQPDIFTSTNGAGGRAAVLNVTNPCVAPSGEPFTVTTTRPAGSGATGNCTSAETETVPTRLLILLSGIRQLPTNATITVRIGTTDITGASIVQFGPSLTPGFEQIVVELPATLAGAGDVPLIVTVTSAAGTFTSRPADSAPHITIQ